ncbi:C40 family peptidase [Oceanobacillus rekensis]|uniref:C40 family peptidase n=1 Tax=Oceanobacillus rekensis TaxID=937927 RepID=UPI001FE50ED4|nr:C40 family peptidase [Oceanobacillus rekensis]
MKKTLMTLTTLAVVGLGSTLFTVSTQAESVQELENKQTEIQEKRETLKANLSDAEGQIADVLVDLDKLNKEIEKVTDALKQNEEQLDDTKVHISEKENEVALLEDEIAELEEAIEKRHEILKERAISYQKSGGEISYLEVIFGSQSFSDFITRVSAVNKITESDSALMKQQEEDKNDVEDKKTAVLNKLDELKETELELNGMLALIKDQKAANESKKEELKNKETKILALQNELQLEDSKLASLEQDVKASLTVASEPAVETTVASASVATTSEESTEGTTSSKEKTTRSNTGSGNLSTAINAGFSHLGTPYVWGGKTPSGFDCSGFVSWAFAQAGISIPSHTTALAGTGTKVSASNMQPGDIVFFDTYKTNGHVGIYLGDGKFIGAQNSTGLAVADMTSGYWADHFSGHVRSVK